MLNISVGSHGMEWTLFLQPIRCCVLDCDQTCADITDILIFMHKVRRLPLLLTLSLQGVGWEWTRSWEGAALGQLIWTGQRAIPCHMTSCSAIKLAADSSSMVTLAVGLAGQRVCPWEVVSDCLCITWGFLNLGLVSFTFLNYLYLHSWVFLPFFFQLSPHPTGVSNQTTGWEFSCWLGSTHQSVCQLKASAFCFCKDDRILMLHCSWKFIDLWSLYRGRMTPSIEINVSPLFLCQAWSPLIWEIS